MPQQHECCRYNTGYGNQNADARSHYSDWDGNRLWHALHHHSDLKLLGCDFGMLGWDLGIRVLGLGCGLGMLHLRLGCGLGMLQCS